MAWISLSAVALAVVLFNFGAMSAWLAVMSLALKIIFLALAIAVLIAGSVVLWRRYR